MKLSYIISIVILLVVFSCTNKNKIDDNTDAFPNADAVYIKLIKEYTLNSDGSYDLHYTHRLKYNSYFSFTRKYGETFIVYNPNYQNLTIDKSQTQMADGKIVTAPENAFNEVLPGFAANAPAYNHLREMVVTHTALEKGAIVDLEYTINTKSDFSAAFSGIENIQQSSPVKYYELRINVPKGTKLNYEVLNDTNKFVLLHKKDFDSYKFVSQNIRASAKEYYADHSYDSKLIFSTGTMKEFIADFVSQAAFSYNLSDETKSWIKKHIHYYKNETADIEEIRSEVCENINSWNIPLKYSGTNIRTVEEVWNSNGGNVLEKNLLLCALLSHANIKAEPIAVIDNYLYHKNLGAMLFSDIVTRVELRDGKTIYLSAVNKNDYNLIHKYGSSVLLPLNIDKSDPYGSPQNSENIINSFSLNADVNLQNTTQIKGNALLKLSNSSTPYLSLIQDSKLSKTLVPGFNVDSYKVIKNEDADFEANYAISSDLEELAEGYYQWTAPLFNKGVNSWHIGELSDKRISNMKLPKAITEKYLYKINIPKSMQFVHDGTQINIENNAGRVYFGYKTEGSQLVFSREIEIPESVINAENYMNFLELMDNWNNSKNHTLVFKNL